jgi:REP element-mobilizing transposase RayT
MTGWHLTFSSSNQFPLFPSEALRRRAVRKIWQVARDVLALFNVMKNHVHVATYCEKHRVGGIRRGLYNSLSAIADTAIDPANVRHVDNRGYMRWLINYHLRTQFIKHKIKESPALWSGSCFQDLIMARHIGGGDLAIKEAVPGFEVEEACEMVGLPPKTIEPAPWELIRGSGINRLAEAACSALAVGPQLIGGTGPVALARRTIAGIGKAVGFGISEVSWVLGITARAVRRLASQPVDEKVIRATRVQLALQTMVRRA